MGTGNDFSKGYLKRWKAKDAALRAQGFPPSKLGPGEPAITTSGFGGTKYQDDNGDIIPKGLKGGK